MPEVDSFPLLGRRVSAVRRDQALDLLEDRIREGRPCHVCVSTVNMILWARRDPLVREAMDTADLVVPDGMPLARIGRHRRGSRVERLRGTDLMLALCERAATNGHRVFLYGGAEGVPERVQAALEARFPGIQVVGAVSPPFRPLTPEEDDAMVEEINAARPDIVWVGLGCPKQERWVVEHRGRVKAPVLVGVGAAFDFLAGTKAPVPKAMEANFEWLWRFVTEPRRLWRRVLVEGPQFVALVAREELTGSWKRDEDAEPNASGAESHADRPAKPDQKG